jgi:uncharacterized protein (TIGR04168 family)
MSSGRVPGASSFSAAQHDRARQRGRIAVIGDVHSAWSDEDVAQLNQSAYELVLVGGDLGGSRARDGLSVARSMARLTRRTLVMPGNNDVLEYARIAAELTYQRGRSDLLGDAEPEPPAAGRGVRICGYSLHRVRLGPLDVTIVAGRPFSMGGPALAFPDLLERSFGVRTLAQSSERLRELVTQADTEHLIFFAHNGPFGLGGQADDPWGRDFHPDAGDWGDVDLRDAIAAALALGQKPLAVVGGHMHRRLRGGGERRWQLRRVGILYVNAAWVPRVFAADGRELRHHVALRLGADGGIAAEDVLLPGGTGS